MLINVLALSEKPRAPDVTNLKGDVLSLCVAGSRGCPTRLLFSSSICCVELEGSIQAEKKACLVQSCDFLSPHPNFLQQDRSNRNIHWFPCLLFPAKIRVNVNPATSQPGGTDLYSKLFRRLRQKDWGIKDWSQAWWQMPVIPVLRRLRKEDSCELKASLGYTVYSRPA